MSGYNDEEEEGKRTVKHKIELSTSDREKELESRLEKALIGQGDAEAKITMYALRDFSRLKDEARGLGVTNDVIDAIGNAEDLQKIVDAKRDPQNFASPEDKGSGGVGVATLGPNYSEDGSGIATPSMPNVETASVSEWENFFEQKLIAKIHELRGRGLSGNEVAKRSVEQLAEWNLSVIKPKGLMLKEKSAVRARQEKALDNLTNKIFLTIQKQEKLRASHSEW